MESFQWLKDLFTTTDSVAHIALLYAIVIAIGVYLGKIKVFGISLGVTFVLFTGILAGHIGFTAPVNILTFVQDFGLILFVFMIGLQVGPGFFENFGTAGLEADTFSGDDRNAGVFYNLSGDFVKPVLPALLHMQGLQRQEENLLRILNTAEGVLVPWQFGFMYSRKDFSIRLVCYLAKDGWTKLPLLMEKLGYEDFPREDFKCLKEFNENVLVDFDVMEDGRLGDVFGLELSSLPKKIHEQQKWIESERIGRLIAQLKEWDIADSRVDMLRGAIFRVRVHPKDMPAFSVKSCFSHFKLRWQRGKKLPAKVYMAISGVLRRR